MWRVNVKNHDALIRKIAAYKNIPIKGASTLYNQEKITDQSTNTSIDVKKLLFKHIPLPNQIPSITPHFKYSHFPSLGNVDLGSTLGTTNSNVQPSYASKISKSKFLRKPQGKAQDPADVLSAMVQPLCNPPFLKANIISIQEEIGLFLINSLTSILHFTNLSKIILLLYRILIYHTYLHSLYHIYCRFFHSYLIN